MDVALLRVGIDRQLGEALAEILRDLQRADLDADPQPVAVEHDVLDMADARRRREGPLLDGLGVAERLQLAPGLALVLADIEMRRQRAGEHHVAALQFAGAARPELVMRQALVDPGPFEAAVVAARHADAARRSEQRAVVERGDAADEHALQGAVLDGSSRARISPAGRRRPPCRPGCVSDGDCARWMLVPPLDSRIIGQRPCSLPANHMMETLQLRGVISLPVQRRPHDEIGEPGRDAREDAQDHDRDHHQNDERHHAPDHLASGISGAMFLMTKMFKPTGG